MDEITKEEIAQHYTALGHSVGLINDTIAGNALQDYDATYKQDCVDRNVEHLEVMLTRDFWTTEDMTAVNAAITAGKAYKAS